MKTLYFLSLKTLNFGWNFFEPKYPADERGDGDGAHQKGDGGGWQKLQRPKDSAVADGVLGDAKHEQDAEHFAGKPPVFLAQHERHENQRAD